ncbi:hypothetical protein THRCLA_06273 [Thraustotheca clavata]|uniref:Uncharacterized protein n=1 Tax=Thraustotheca clavata TaxID=74557 RepID=A0A1V9ZPX6_9STRA|nr:hypothetical protein THRCLA_06273 [Thraustotheca clavata]
MTTTTNGGKKTARAKTPENNHMPFFMTKKNAPNVTFTRGHVLAMDSPFNGSPSHEDIVDDEGFVVGSRRSGLHSDLFKEFPAPAPPKPTVDYEHENKLLQEEVLRLESQLVTIRCDLAVKDFELLGVNSENQYLRRHIAQNQTKFDEALGKLQAQLDYATTVVHQQEQVLRRQAREIEESKGWILNQYFTGCVDDTVPKPALWHDPNTLPIDIVEASVIESAWASSITSIATPLLHSPSIQQQKIVSQLEDVENLLARCVEHQKASVSEVTNIEMAMEEDREQYYNGLEEPVEVVEPEATKTDDGLQAFEFDALISELNGLVCRYDSVTSVVS